MSKSSIRQPLVIYAVVLALAVSLAMLAFTGLALSRAAHRAYGRAVRQELLLFARAGLFPAGGDLEHEVLLGLVTTSSPALGIDVQDARSLARGESEGSTHVVVALPSPAEEMYLVARLPSEIPTSIALVELSRVMLPVLLSALGAAGLMALLVYRQLLPSLRALAEVADEPRTTPPGLAGPDAPNEIVEIALRFRDTTRQLRDARERAEAQRDELERMQAGLIRASKLASIGRLAAGIAHEIGNPLAAVKGYLSLMQDGLPEPDRSEALRRSVKELERIHQIIQKLLAYARTGSEVPTPPEPVELRVCLSDALALARGHEALRDVQILDEVPDDDLRVLGQPSRLGQVLINLLLNAGQAMPAPPRMIRLVRTADDDTASLSIVDTGPGVAPELTESIFDPFFTTKGPGEGTGLGLAVSRAMVESMGGCLELSASTGGAGATFTIRLQRADAS